ncbi:carbonic anhydrase [Talaromyces proteolyticus]|uniref:Carbonic anhydrase n=1 Tax=Talaromyces proteolyticus TaxID=1131652 RepID=A0AAD4Q1A4_9EURO|nr:carbonic anhydrase [Talaromyces proteolyticus]KAH8705415.1 carbonic anhydrase [Talaromyces proteolyticus]
MSQNSAFTTDIIVDRNQNYASKIHSPLPMLHDANGVLRKGTGMLVVSCVDPRIIPESFLGFRIPGENPLAIPVIRVIGGRARHALVNIVGLDAVFGIDTVVIIHHTDCGLTHNTEESIRTSLKTMFPGKQETIENTEFGAIENLEQSVVDDIQFLKYSPLIRKEIVLKGFVYDIHTGKLKEICKLGEHS